MLLQFRPFPITVTTKKSSEFKFKCQDNVYNAARNAGKPNRVFHWFIGI